MGTSVPPIGVKFTADTDGVAAAVRELTGQIRGLGSAQRQNARDTEEMANAGKKAAGEISKLSSGLATLGTTIGIARLGRLVQDAVDTGDAIYKLSQKTGASTEALSVLAFAGKTAEVSLEDLGSMLKFLSKSLGELQRGDPGTVASFKAIGLSAKDLKGLSVDQVLVKIANAQQHFADSTGKAEVMLKLFGRSGTEIIPLLNDLAGGGFDRAAEAASRLGIVWSREAAKGAQDFNDSITVLKAAAEGMAGSFASEVTPTLTKFFQGTTQLLTELPGPAKQVVTNLVAIEAGVLGLAGAWRILSFAFTAAKLTTPLGIILTGLGAVAAVLLTFAHNADQAKQKYESFLGTLTTTKAVDEEKANLEKQLDNAEAQLAAARQAAQQAKVDRSATQPRSSAVDDLFRQHGALPATPRAGTPQPEVFRDPRFQSQVADAARVGDQVTPAIRQAQERIAQLHAQLDALAQRRAELGGKNGPDVVVPDPSVLAARRAAEQAAIQQELQLQQELLRAKEAMNQQEFDHGLKDITAYYARRKELIQQGIDAEVKALEDERTLIEKTPATTAAEKVKKDADLKKGGRIDQQVTKTRIKGQEQIDELTVKERDDQRALAEERLGFESQIMEAQGRTLQAALAGIDQQARKFDELLKKQGVADPDRATQVNQFRNALGTRARIDDVSQQAQRAFAEIERERDQIAQQVSVGALTEQQGQEQLAAFEAARLPTLRALADQMLQFATTLGDPALIAAAQQLTLQVGGIAAAADLASQRSAKFRADVLEAGKSALTGFLDNGIGQIGQPDPNSGAIEVRQREAEEIQRQIEEANAAAADGDKAAAGRVRALTAEYESLQDRIAELKNETFGLDDAMRQFFTDVLDGIRKALDQMIAAKIIGGLASLFGGGGAVPTFAEGGYIGGVGSPTSDSNIIAASRGEFMQPSRAVQHYGVRFMEDVRTLRLPKFATGGLIGDASIAGIRSSVIAPTVRVPSAASPPPAIPDGALLRRTELAGELHVGLDRGLIMDTIRSYMGSKDAEQDHIRLSAATKSRRRGAGT